VAIDLSGRFVYVANVGSNNISAYRIVKNGALTDAHRRVAFSRREGPLFRGGRSKVLSSARARAVKTA
jgi:6-phosphogluconolactonase (cycloisomerase 2 family)